MTKPLEKQTVAQLRKAATKKKNRVWHTFQNEEGRTHQLFERRERGRNQNVCWTQPQSDASPVW